MDGPVRTSAPLTRLLGSELAWILGRPRTWVGLAVVAAVPVLMAVAIATFGGPEDGEGPGVVAAVAGNWLVLPIAALTVSLSLLLPLVVSVAAADALAGEANHGTLRGLLLAPVGRVRLLGVKAVGVLAVTVLAVAVMTGFGLAAGGVLIGGADLLTLSGTTLGLGGGLLRVLTAAVWVLGQLVAVAAVALAISATTDHPLVVVATTLGGLVAFTVLGAIPALDWLQPVLLTTGFDTIIDVLRDPIAWDGLATSTARAGCYALIGISLAAARMLTRDG